MDGVVAVSINGVLQLLDVYKRQTYDSQTSDTGLDTRLEAFYDMLSMKKEKSK